MDFHLTPDQEAVRDLARQIAKGVCEPEAEIIDRERRFPIETFRKFAETGLYGVGLFSEEYGGTGKDKIADTLIVEELSKVSLSHGVFSKFEWARR